MKKTSFLFGILLTLLLSACENEFIESQNSFEVSKATWEDFRDASGASYVYTATSGSWTGTSSSTTIRVQEGKVLQRAFAYEVFDGFKKPANGWNESARQEILATFNLTEGEYEEEFGKPLSAVLEWQEEGETLGSHQNSGAADTLTLDEIYAKAENEWMVKNENRQTYFEAKNNGMISLCGYVPDGCQDDCFTGIRIASIAAI